MSRLSTAFLVAFPVVCSLAACNPSGSSAVNAGGVSSTAAVGQPAPDFTLPSTDGKTVSLKEQAGKVVVLEWFNPGCPFVKYAHGEGPLKDLAATTTQKGVTWLAINSGSPGAQGAGVEANKEAVKTWNIAHPVLLDESGEVGKKYGATTTPHMFVVDAAGKIAYIGALDNAPLGKADGPLQNYVTGAVDALLAGKAVPTAATKSYGCGVKYAK